MTITNQFNRLSDRARLLQAHLLCARNFLLGSCGTKEEFAEEIKLFCQDCSELASQATDILAQLTD